MPRPFSAPLLKHGLLERRQQPPPPTFPQGSKCSRTAARAEVRENSPIPERKPAAKGGHGFSNSKLPDHSGGKNGHRAGRGLGKPSPWSVPDSPVQGIDSSGSSRAEDIGRYQARSRDKVRLSRTLRQFLNKIQISNLGPKTTPRLWIQPKLRLLMGTRHPRARRKLACKRTPGSHQIPRMQSPRKTPPPQQTWWGRDRLCGVRCPWRVQEGESPRA